MKAWEGFFLAEAETVTSHADYLHRSAKPGGKIQKKWPALEHSPGVAGML